MRRSGKTTRTIDRCIQELFTKGFCYVYESRTEGKINRELHEKFIERLEREHSKAKYVSHFDYYDEIPCFKVELHNL